MPSRKVAWQLELLPKPNELRRRTLGPNYRQVCPYSRMTNENHERCRQRNIPADDKELDA